MPIEAPKVTQSPFDTCIVSGDKRGAMGYPIVVVHVGSDVKLCCKGDITYFHMHPAAFFSKNDVGAWVKADNAVPAVCMVWVHR